MFTLKWQIIFVLLKHLFLHVSVLADSMFYVPHLHAIKKSETTEGNISFVQADSRKVQQFSQYPSLLLIHISQAIYVELSPEVLLLLLTVAYTNNWITVSDICCYHHRLLCVHLQAQLHWQR